MCDWHPSSSLSLYPLLKTSLFSCNFFPLISHGFLFNCPTPQCNSPPSSINLPTLFSSFFAPTKHLCYLSYPSPNSLTSLLYPPTHLFLLTSHSSLSSNPPIIFFLEPPSHFFLLTSHSSLSSTLPLISFF
jgi:hypothetical protein